MAKPQSEPAEVATDGASSQPAPRPTHPLDYLAERYPSGGADGGYQLVVNAGTLQSVSYELGYGVELRRAASNEHPELRFLVRYYHPTKAQRQHPWETRIEVTRDGDPNTQWFEFHPLGEENFRYCVLAYAGRSNYAVNEIAQASILSTAPEFELGVSLGFGEIFHCGSGGLSIEDFRKRVAFDDSAFDAVTDAGINDLKSLLPAFFALPQDDVLRRAIGDYIALRTLPHTPLKVLGLFALLESILTHKPRDTDPYQAVGRQVKAKMQLLDHRFKRPANYGASRSRYSDVLLKLWSALYDVRSTIAHGSPLDFTQGIAAKLGSVDVVHAIVRDVLRSLLRQMLEEPQLLKDLKNC